MPLSHAEEEKKGREFWQWDREIRIVSARGAKRKVRSIFSVPPPGPFPPHPGKPSNALLSYVRHYFFFWQETRSGEWRQKQKSESDKERNGKDLITSEGEGNQAEEGVRTQSIKRSVSSWIYLSGSICRAECSLYECLLPPQSARRNNTYPTCSTPREWDSAYGDGNVPERCEMQGGYAGYVVRSYHTIIYRLFFYLYHTTIHKVDRDIKKRFTTSEETSWSNV